MTSAVSTTCAGIDAYCWSFKVFLFDVAALEEEEVGSISPPPPTSVTVIVIFIPGLWPMCYSAKAIGADMYRCHRDDTGGYDSVLRSLGVNPGDALLRQISSKCTAIFPGCLV